MATVHHLGIDVDSRMLVNCFKEQGRKDREFSIGNSEEGIASLVEMLGDRIVQTRVVVEATSRYHLRVVRTLKEAGACVVVMNPARSRALATGLGILDKDDKVDARMLARAAQMLTAKETELRSRTHEELRDLSRHITTQTQLNAENKKRLCSLEPQSAAYRCLKETILVLAAQIQKAKKLWNELLPSEPEIQRRYKIAISVGSIGVESARVAACELPANLDEFTLKQLCAYGGVVPRRDRSGTRQGKDKIGKTGNQHLRTGLYMAASNSVYISKRNHEFYAELRAKGRTHLQAMVAVIHRLLRQVVAVVKRNTPWERTPPRKKNEAAISVAANA